MKYIQNIGLSVLLSILWMHAVMPNTAHAYEHLPMIDLGTSDEAFQKELYTDLDGSWIFFAEEFLMSGGATTIDHDGSGEIVSIPGSFDEHMGKVNAYGTYRTHVTIPDHYVDETIAIHIPFQYSAYTLFIDQAEVITNGVVGHDVTSHEAEMVPRTAYFIPQSEDIVLTMHVSSFEHIRGGFENSIFIGDASVATQTFNTNMIVTLFINGSIVSIDLFMVLFALYRKRDHIFMIFGIFAMLIAARALFTVPFYYTITFLDMPWIWGTRLEYIFTEATSMFFVILLWKSHEAEFSKKVMAGLVFIHASLIAITLFTKPVFFQTLFFNVFYLAIPTFFYAIYVIYKSIRNHNTYAKVNLVGMGLIFLVIFNDFAIGQNSYQSVRLMQLSVGVYVVMHVFFMSKNFANSVRQTEQQNKQLMALNDSNEQ